MLYNNLIYFLVVIFVFSTNTPPDTPKLSAAWTVTAFAAILWIFSRFARTMFARTGDGPIGYFATEKKMSILAVLIFVFFVYLLDLKRLLLPLSLKGSMPAFTDIAGLGCFFLLLGAVWTAARSRYQEIFQRRYSPLAFVRANIKANLPMVLPWIALSLCFDLLAILPIPSLKKLLHTSWGDATFFSLFLVFLILAFPPLVRFLWNCKPLPPGPLRDRIVSFCRTQGFSSEILSWPLFEGQILTAGIMGIIPGLRYLMITPALLAALNEDELDSVIAHEIGHVKHLHLALYIVLFLGFSILTGALTAPLPHWLLSSNLFYFLLPLTPIAPEHLLEALTTIPPLLLMLFYFRFIFGYFIRNFERQADLYVFKAIGTSWPLITSFEKIALLSGSNRDEKNWHHFGIGERIDFLRQCETNRHLIKRHTRKVSGSLALYCLGIALLSLTLQQVDATQVSSADETKYAEAVLTQKALQEPKNGMWFLFLGDYLHHRKMEQKAIAAYEKALMREPMNAEANNNLAWLLLTAQEKSLRNPTRALALAQTAVRVKERGYIVDTLATAYWANGALEEALAAERKAMELDADNRAYYQSQMDNFTQRQWEGKE